MPGEDNGGETSNVSAIIPTTEKSALQKTAYHKSSPSRSVSVSMLVKQAVEEWLVNHQDELPKEALDDLDEDLLANGGAGGGF